MIFLYCLKRGAFPEANPTKGVSQYFPPSTLRRLAGFSRTNLAMALSMNLSGSFANVSLFWFSMLSSCCSDRACHPYPGSRQSHTIEATKIPLNLPLLKGDFNHPTLVSFSCRQTGKGGRGGILRKRHFQNGFNKRR